MTYKAGDKVHVKLPNGVEWDDEVRHTYGSGAGVVDLKMANLAIQADRCTPLTPPIAPGTLVAAWYGGDGYSNHRTGYYIKQESDGRHRIGGLAHHLSAQDSCCYDHVRPLAVKARRWADLTERERTKWSWNHNVYDAAYDLITGGSEYLIVEPTP